MGKVIGIDCVLNYKAGGIAAGGAWAELTNVKDVGLDLSRDSADTTTRANNGWKSTTFTLADAAIDFEMVYDYSDAGFIAIRDAYFDNTILGIQMLDDAGHGVQADVGVEKFSIKQNNSEAVMVSVSLKPTYSGTAPSRV